MVPGRHGGSGDETDEVRQDFGGEAALERLDEAQDLAVRTEPLAQDPGQGGEDRPRREDVGEGQGHERLDGTGRALRVGVEAPEALDGVAEELDADGLASIGGEDVEDASAPGDLAGGGHRVLPRVAPLVERLQEDLGRHLVARAKVDDARLEQPRGEARPQEPGRGRDHGEGGPRLQEGGRAARGGVGVARQSAEGGRARGGQREDFAREPGLGREGAQVRRHLVHVALARHDEEQRRLEEQ